MKKTISQLYELYNNKTAFTLDIGDDKDDKKQQG